MSPFKARVVKAVQSIPYGKVASYGQVALMVGMPRGARQVGWILNSLEGDIGAGVIDLPWWRVINNAGRISIKGSKQSTPMLQKDLLEKEGVIVQPNLDIDIEKYRLRPSVAELLKLELDDEYIHNIVTKYQI